MTLSPLRISIAALDTSPLPISLDLAKQHCAVDGDEFDALLTAYILAAVAWAENTTRRTIFARSHRWVLGEFPATADQAIMLPRGRTVSVESVAYTTGGSVHTLTGPTSTPAGTGYQEDLAGEDGGVIMPVRGASWSSVDLDVVAPVAISFTAGWPADAVPEDLLHAMLFAVSDMYESRNTIDVASAGRDFQTRDLLASSYRLHRWY